MSEILETPASPETPEILEIPASSEMPDRPDIIDSPSIEVKLYYSTKACLGKRNLSEF